MKVYRTFNSDSTKFDFMLQFDFNSLKTKGILYTDKYFIFSGRLTLLVILI